MKIPILNVYKVAYIIKYCRENNNKHSNDGKVELKDNY